MLRYFLACFLFLLSFSSAYAGNGCFSRREVQAEQLLRLHSELMVISLTCRSTTRGQDLVGAYKAFTDKNISLFKEAEGVLSRFYEKDAAGQGVSKLDRLRTRLANEYAQVVARETPKGFCAARRDKAMALYDSPASVLYDTASRLYARTKTDKPACRMGIKTRF